MKKLLATLLILCAGPVWAEWVLIAANNDGDRIFYDPLTIRGQTIKRTWTKWELKTINDLGMRSGRLLVEIDCPNERSRNLQHTTFDEPGLNGKVVNQQTISSPQWEYVEPGSVFATVFKTVCGKK